MSIGKTMLGRRHVMPSVVGSLSELMVEGTFPTGTYLVTVHHPISTEDGDLEKALYGSFLPIPSQDMFPLPDASVYEAKNQPGAIIAVKDRITINEGRKRIQLKVVSKGDRPIQVSQLFVMKEIAIHTGFSRSVLTTTSLKRIPSSTLTVCAHMAIASTFLPGHLFVSSPVIRRL